jgi:hypothetical protein
LNRFLPTILLAIALGSPAACNVAFTTASANGSDGPPIVGDGDSGASDDGGSDVLATPNDAGASAYVGSPLCNFSNALSTCNPDEGLTAQSCPTAPVSDAGATDAQAPPESYRCSVDVKANVTSQDCTPAGRGVDGDACQHGSDCAAGFECVGSGVCRHYCCDYTECDKLGKLTFCDVQTMTSGTTADTRVPVCMPVMSCKLLLAGYCDQGETCAPVRSDGTTSCVAIGPQKVGDPCDRDHCDKDLACLGAPGNRTCYQLCHTDSTGECPAGKKCKTSSAEFLDPTIGVCQ